MKKVIVFLLLLTIPFLQGCGIGVMAAGIGTGIRLGRKGEAEKIKARAEAYKIYQEVVMQYEERNRLRKEQGLEPLEIPSYEEWLNIIADKKVRKVADIETKKDQITGKEEIRKLKEEIKNNN